MVMIHIVSLDKNMEVKNEFTNLLIKYLKKLNIVKKLWKNALRMNLSGAKKITEIFEKLTNFMYVINYILKKDTRVRDNCHKTGDYWGPAHQFCNDHYRLTQKISVIFHIKGMTVITYANNW